MYGYAGYMNGPFDSLLWILVWVAIVSLIIRLIRGPRMYGWHGMRHRNWGGRTDALDILRERYAKGEINKAEFEEKKADLIKE